MFGRREKGSSVHVSRVVEEQQLDGKRFQSGDPCPANGFPGSYNTVNLPFQDLVGLSPTWLSLFR